MAELVKHEMYVKSNVAGNNNKFWEIKLYDDFSVHVRNGRIGGSGQDQKPKEFGSMSAAEAFWDKKVREKTSDRKGYVKFKGVLGESSETTVTSSNGNLTSIALKEIDTTSSETAKLIKYLSKKNIHNITQATTITYDESKGTFRTPLGIVTQEGIDEARELLDELAPYIVDKDFDNPDFIEKLQAYIQLIPRKVGRKLISSEVIPDGSAMQKESQILDSLDASLQEVTTSSDDDKDKKKDAPKLFNVKLDLVKDSKIIKHVEKFYNKTRNSMHTSYNLKVKRVYSVNIEKMSKAFDKKVKEMDKKGGHGSNQMELWHGTQVSNVLSILKGGLVVPKSSAGHVTGRLFGDGIYMSDQSTKSLNYSQGYWGGTRDNNCFMFLCSAAMGKYYVPDGRSYGSYPRKGYDSTFAKANKSGVRNNEMIVYSLNQCNLNYLVEFSDR